MIATGSKTGGPQASGPLTGPWPRQEPGCTAGGEQQASEQSFIRIYSRSPSLTSLLQSCLTHCDPMACSPPATGDPMAPLSMGFSRQEYWSGLPCPPPGDLPLDFSKGHNKYNNTWNHSPHSWSMENCLPQNWSLVPKRLGTIALREQRTTSAKPS